MFTSLKEGLRGLADLPDAIDRANVTATHVERTAAEQINGLRDDIARAELIFGLAIAAFLLLGTIRVWRSGGGA